MKFTKIFLICLTLFSFQEVFAEDSSVKLSIHLLNYLAKDYGGAVENGKVISKFEYDEQIEFAAEVLSQSEKGNFPNELKLKVRSLKASIEKLDSAEIVSAKALEIKGDLIRVFSVKTNPSQAPNFSIAKQLFQTNCMQCHGQTGIGDGPLGKDMDPKPANFLDSEAMSNLSPYQAFNTITLGVQGTGMPPFTHLNEDDRWSLAFYLLSMRFKEQDEKPKLSLNLSLAELSVLTETEITVKHLSDLKEKERNEILAFLRTQVKDPADPAGPAGGAHSTGTKQSIEVARQKLKSSFNEYKAQNISEASRLALESYLEGIEPIEGQLKIKDSELLVELETVLLTYRASVKDTVTPAEVVESNYQKSRAVIQKVENVLLSSGTTLFNTAFITFGVVIREAFEAGLVLLLLFSILRRVQATHAMNWVHGGWLGALGIGVLCYFLLERFIPVTGELAESMEAYVGIFAVMLLLYVGLWFHRNSSIDMWKRFLTTKVNSSLEKGRLMSLSLIAFLAVFREVIETILFIKILRFDGHSSSAIVIGGGAAIIMTLAIIYLMVRMSLKINLDKLFKFSTFTILALAVILTGKSVIAFQKVGLINSDKLFTKEFLLFGFNSTLQVLFAQCLIVMLIFILIRLSKKTEASFIEVRD